MVDLILRKRKARAGEIGLFCDAEVFAEQWQSIKIDTEVDVKATTAANAKYNRLSWHIANLVCNSSENFDHPDEARDAVLIECRHYRRKFDKLRDKAELEPKPTRNLDGTAWLALIKRMVHVATTVYGIPEAEIFPNGAEWRPEPPPHEAIPDHRWSNAAREEAEPPIENPDDIADSAAAEAMQPARASMDDGDDDAPAEPEAHPEPPQAAVEPGKRDWAAQGPRGPDEYVAYARDYIDAAKDLASTIAWLNSEEQWALRKACGVDVPTRKGLERYMQQREWKQ